MGPLPQSHRLLSLIFVLCNLHEWKPPNKCLWNTPTARRRYRQVGFGSRPPWLELVFQTGRQTVRDKVTQISESRVKAKRGGTLASNAWSEKASLIRTCQPFFNRQIEAITVIARKEQGTRPKLESCSHLYTLGLS